MGEVKCVIQLYYMSPVVEKCLVGTITLIATLCRSYNPKCSGSTKDTLIFYGRVSCCYSGYRLSALAFVYTIRKRRNEDYVKTMSLISFGSSLIFIILVRGG